MYPIEDSNNDLKILSNMPEKVAEGSWQNSSYIW